MARKHTLCSYFLKLGQKNLFYVTPTAGLTLYLEGEKGFSKANVLAATDVKSENWRIK